MPDFTQGKYNNCKDWIRKQKENHYSWDEIKKCCVNDDDVSNAFKDLKYSYMVVPLDMTLKDWSDLVSVMEQDYIELIPSDVEGIYTNAGPVDYPVPSGMHDGWVQYIKLLKGEKDGKRRMTDRSVSELESNCYWILNRIRKDTREKGPQKGLVMGSVQSGKTSAMIGLVTMAAHYDWNFIIILSGTIENLRVQTRNRFVKDIQRCQDADWHFLESSSNEDYLKDISENKYLLLRDAKLNFSEPDTVKRSPFHETYVMTCLKQASRLRKLLKWLHSEAGSASRLRILVIDDEADQASINTAKMSDAEIKNRTAINQLIIDLANGVDEDGGKSNFQALNYIAFTATPYANVLNEAYKESLYPKDFIMCLPENDSYFGSKVIWGSKKDDDYPGMDIIRVISDESDKAIKMISKGEYCPLPEDFKDSVAWFICCVAVLRLKKWKKPISMLINTSTGNMAHFNMYESLKTWMEQDRTNGDLKSRCNNVYERETKKFTYLSFENAYGSYELLESVDKTYPSFSEIEGEINELLSEKAQNIEVVDDKETPLHYSSKSVHVCVDNCKARKYADDSEVQLRIVYPDDEQLDMLDKAPAFIVIGGNTLSRGLTIEGLVSTYFSRNSNQADSLMQMARWYGYRKGYELLPRIWMTPKVITKYKLLEEIDEKLRKTLADYKKMGKNPSKIYPAVMSTSAISKFLLTAKNKSQNMIPMDMDFSGDSYETTEFYDDTQKLLNNLKLTESFIEKLGKPEKSKVYPESSYIWKLIPSKDVLNYLDTYEEYKPCNFNDQIRDFISWMKKENSKDRYLEWNVAVCGSSTFKGQKWVISGMDCEFGKVERTKLKRINTHIDIGSMRSGKDGVCDVDPDKCENVIYLNEGKKGKHIEFVRGKLGYSDIPLLLLYCIDKDGGTDKEHKVRVDTKVDIIAYSVIIAGDSSLTDHVESVVVRSPEEDDDDIEE